jgi:hypothetical protein
MIVQMSKQARPGIDADDSEIVKQYMLTRKFLSLGFLAYAATFSLSYVYFVSRA